MDVSVYDRLDKENRKTANGTERLAFPTDTESEMLTITKSDVKRGRGRPKKQCPEREDNAPEKETRISKQRPIPPEGNTLTEEDYAEIRYMARNYAKRCETLTEEDLYQEGVLCLLNRKQNFDSERDNSNYRAFIVYNLRSWLERYIQQAEPFVRLPYNASENGRQVEVVPFGENGEEMLLMDEDTKREVLDWEKTETYKDMLRKMIGVMRIEGRMKDILELRYGIKDGEEHSLQYIGEIYGMTSERVRQEEARAIKLLRCSLMKPRLDTKYDEIMYESDV